MTTNVRLKILYIHGRNSSSKTAKAVYLGKTHNVHCEDMDTNDVEKCYNQQALALSAFSPDVVVGSSFGGHIAMLLLTRRVWKGPTVLLAQAHNLYQNNSGIIPGLVPVVLVHSSRDDIVPVQGSRLLAKTGTADLVELIEVDDEHRLDGTIESGMLLKAIYRVMELKKRGLELYAEKF